MPRKNQGWITFQASEEERQILEDYCNRSQRTKTDILRELVRSLEHASQPNPLDHPDPEMAEVNEDDEALKLQQEIAISARNLLRSTVKDVTIDGVNAEVTLAVEAGVELTAVITRSSAQRLHLAIGKEVFAVIKSSNVMIATITS